MGSGTALFILTPFCFKISAAVLMHSSHITVSYSMTPIGKFQKLRPSLIHPAKGENKTTTTILKVLSLKFTNKNYCVLSVTKKSAPRMSIFI